MYLEHAIYREMGGTIQEEHVYARYAERADNIISRMTHGRIRDETPVRPCVQYAAYALIEAMRADDAEGVSGREAVAMSNDGMSVTYASSGNASVDRARRYAAIVSDYLEFEVDANGTPLLYAGVDA